MTKIYKHAEDFRKGLESKLQQLSLNTAVDLQRLRRQVAFDRFLARIFSSGFSSFCLKGGYGMELTYQKSRATKDIDLIMKHREQFDEKLVHRELSALSEQELGDYFSFRVLPARKELANPIYGGFRFPIAADVAGRTFVDFKIDVASDIFPEQTRIIEGSDWLSFIAIPPPKVLAISLQQQFAEKIHAYSLPRDRDNARTKDLIDLLLLIRDVTLERSEIEPILKKVFKIRNTHLIPENLPTPPSAWSNRFKEMARECGMDVELADGFAEVQTFFKQLKTLESFSSI